MTYDEELFAMLLMVALCVGLVTVANAADSGSFVDSNNRQGYWALDDAGVLTISGNANIPSQSTAPYTVYRPNIKFIIIKDGVQTINTDAFSEYNALRSIIIPDSVNTIYHGIFNYCYNLVSVVYHGTEEPQKVASDFYRNAFDGLTIYVPTGYPYKDGFLEKLVNIKVSDTTPNVSFSANGGTGTMESIKTLSGATIVLPSCKFTAPNNNFKAWSVNGVEYQPGALLTVEKDTTIKAVWAKPIYSISINQPSVDGKVTVAKSTAQAGETIQMTVKMDNTDKVPVFDVRDANGNAITVTDDYTFTMPASNVTINVEFEYCTHKKFKEQSDGTVKCVACGDLAYFKVTTKDQVVTYHTNLNNKNTGALEIVERNPGCTLTVLADHDWTIQINSNCDFILDLGGHTVTASSHYALQVGGNGAKVLVKNGTLTCSDSFHYGVVGVAMSSATLTLDGVIVKNNASKDSIPCITNVGALKIVGGTQLTGNNQVISVQNEQALTDLSNATNPSGWTVANGIVDVAIPVTTDSNVASGIILGEDYVMRVEDALVNEVKSRESGIIEHNHVAAQPYTDNGNGTHNATCECGAVVTEDCVFTNSYPVGLKCICGALGKELVVTGGTEGTDYTYVNGVVTILTETPITIKNASNVETSRHRIVINPGEGKSANVTFAGLFLDPEVYYPTVAISSGTAKISPLGTNELHPPKVEANAYGASNATIHVPGNTSLILDGTGTLDVLGQGQAAAIGASSTSSGAAGQCGKIIINNGTYNVVQRFSQGGAGIGGASNRDSFGSGSMGGITINGGTVNVVGTSSGGAAIGGGYNANGGKIIINGGTVTTEDAAIGGGYDESYGKKNTNATVSITGGTVNAEYISAKTTMEAGKLNLGRAEELTMKGGTVESIGGIARLYMYDGIMNINVSERFYGMEQAGIGGSGTYRDSCKFEMYGGKVTVNAAYVGIGGYYDSDEGNASGTIKFCGGELIVENTNTTVDSYAGIGSDRKNHSITMNISPAKNTMITVRAGKTLNSLETLATVSAGEPLTYSSSDLTVERKAWHLTTAEVVDPDYTVSITTPNNGTVTADVATEKAGATVPLTVTPNVGYVVDYVKYNDTTITPVNGVYSFTMPAENVAVTAIFKVCDHEGSTHTIFDNTGEKHSYICTLCSATVTEDHTFDTDTCPCGAKAVADVDGVKFGKFDDAVAAWQVPTAKKLTLLADVKTSYIELTTDNGTQKVLELNGWQLKLTAITALTNHISLTIQDSSETGTGSLYSNNQYATLVTNHGELNITGGTFEVIDSAATLIANEDEGTLFISGVTTLKNEKMNRTAVHARGTVTISGDVMIAASIAIKCYGDVDVSGANNCVGWTVSNYGGTLKLPPETALLVGDKLVQELEYNQRGTIVEHTHAAKTYADNGDESHRVTCACGEVMESGESHTFTEANREWKCPCGAKAVVDIDGTKFRDFQGRMPEWAGDIDITKMTLLADVETTEHIGVGYGEEDQNVLDLNGFVWSITSNEPAPMLDVYCDLTIMDTSNLGTGKLCHKDQQDAVIYVYEGKLKIVGDVKIDAPIAIRFAGAVDLSEATSCIGWIVWHDGGTLTLPADTALQVGGTLVQKLEHYQTGTIVAHTHSYTNNGHDDNNHWKVCACGAIDGVVAHSYTTNANETHHWTACTCGVTTAQEPHGFQYVDNQDGKTHKVSCDCGYEKAGVNHDVSTGECVCGAKAVADVDGVKYANLDDAVAAWEAPTANKLTLLDNVEYVEVISLESDEAKTLELNGKTLTSTTSANYALDSDCPLTIDDSSTDRTGKFVADKVGECVVYCNGSTLMLNGGTITMNRASFVLVLNGTTTTINSDNVKLSSNLAAIKIINGSNLTISGNGCDGWKIWNQSGKPSPIQIPNGFHLEDEAGNMLETNDKLPINKYTVIKVDHIHNWSYAANDAADTITATCDAAGCPKPQQSMTLVAPEKLVYDGTAKTVTIDGSIEGVQMPSINITGDTTNVTEEGCTATITVAGETAKLSFQIVPASIEEATVSVEDQTYTGDAITPEVIVSLDNKKLTLNTDYTVAYADNVNVSKATITVTGKGNYTGTATGVFNIKAASIEAAQITVANQIYTGEAITPEIATVKLGEKTLVKDTDYTVEYTDNINVGEATVTVNGMGNYAGTVEAKFQISKSDADVAAKSYLGETEQSAFFYGDVITVKGSAAVAQTFALRAPTNKAQLYFDGILLAEGDVSGNSFTLSYNTTEKKLPVGPHTLTVEFGGNGNLNGKAVTVTVTLNKAAPDVTAPTGLSATYGQTLADITLPTVVNGVWSWKEDNTTQVGNAGEQTYVLVFTPNNSSFVNVAEVNANITVSPLELKVVTAPSDLELTAYHATAEEVKNQLPATITVNGADNKTYKLPVTWTCDPFNDQPNGESTFTWTAELGDNFTATDVATTGTITVTNGSALSVTITGTNQETTYNGNSYDVSGMFTIDPNAGAATYAIVEGGTGAGTLEGSVLTITKAGTITIKVSTAQKLPYAAGEASATLTVNKGELSVEPLTNLTAVYGDTLSAVALPENWAWKTPETKVGDVGDRVHIAVYNTDPNLWNDKEVSLTIRVNKASIQLDASFKTFLGEVEQTTFTYGDVITVKVTPVMPMLLSAELVAPAPNQMALFYGSQQISSPVDAVNGTYTMEYATTDKVLPTGESKLTVRYVGNGNTNDASSDLPVMINPKTVTLSAVKAVSRAYDPSSLTVGIESATLEGVLNNDDVAVDTLALQATIDKADAGTYTEVLLPEPIKLIGTAAQYYKATGGRIAADVTITKAALTPAGTPNLGDVMPGTPLGDVPTGPIVELFKPVEGTVTWKDPAETPVEPGKEYEWKFTPVDPNYDSVTDSVVIIPNTSFLVIVVNGTGSGEYEEGKTVTITANAPATGKWFAGWTSDDVSFANANATTTSFTMPAKVVTVVANYIDVPVSVHYTVVYNANGGTGVMANQYFNSGETKALLPNVFTRDGYTFKGWNTKADGAGTAYADGQVVTMYSAAILYAQWMPVEAPVVIPLEITQQPTDQMVAPGEKAQFSIVANGDGVTYQWYINRNDGRGWVKLQGATNAVHETSAADLAYDGQTQDSFAEKNVKLVADVNLGDAEKENNPDIIFYPIGYYNSTGSYEKTSGGSVTSSVSSFEGTFDGNGHIIKNFYQNTWEMFGDYNDGYSGKPNHYKDAMGLFGYVLNGTVKNLTVDNFSSDGEYTPTGVIAAYADGDSTFENIAITNCNPRVYNTGNGGIIGIAGDTSASNDDHITLKNITVDNSNKISALWGSYDVACGGLVGMYRGNVDGSGNATDDTISFENCHVAAQIDVYNDVCANYQYYAYRYAGMMIGSVRHNEVKDGKTIPNMAGITAKDCTVNYGDWNDYYYCEFEKNTMASYSEDYQFSRVPHSELNFTDSNGNGVVDADERASVTGCKHTHTAEENHQAVYLPFHQLFTGYSWGVSSIGLEKYSGIVTNLDITEGDQQESVEKFVSKFTGDFLYRVGNQNTVVLDSLFKATEGVTINPTGVYVTIDKVDENMNVSGKYTASTTKLRDETIDWTKGTIQFSGTGVVKVTIQDYNFCKPTVLELEVVDAVNVTGATSATANNVVLLNDCGFSSLEVSGGYTLFGNGFTMTCGSDSAALDMGYSFVTLDNGTLDNVQIVCPNFDYAVLYKSNMTESGNRSETTDRTRYYNVKSGVMVSGNSQILNSRISGGRAAVNVTGGNCLIDNSRIELGAVASLLVGAANSLTLRDVTLVQKPTASTYDSSKTLMGFSVLFVCDANGDTAPVTLEGTLVQNAWVNESDKQYVPSAGQSIISTVLGKTEYLHDIDGDGTKESLNLGFAYMPESLTSKVNTTTITDNRTNKNDVSYDYAEVSILNGKTYVYSYKNTNGTADPFKMESEYTPNKQGDIITVNYADTANGLTTGKSFGTDGWVYELNVDLDKLSGYALDFSKLSMSVNGTTVTDFKVNGNAKPTSPVAVTAGGVTYTLTATVDGKEYSATYKVTGTETSKESPSLVAANYEAGLCVASSYGGTWHGAAPALQGIQIKYWSVAEKQYKTINLADYTPTTKGQQNGTNTTWTYTPANGDFTLTLTGGQVHSSNNVYAMPVVCDGKLYFVAAKSNGLVNSGNSARTIPVSYTFKDNNNGDVLTFSHTWSVAENKDAQYKYSDFCNGTLTKLEASSGGSGCVTPDTLITLANGTQVRVDNLTGNEKLLVWNLETGMLDEADIMFVDNDPKAEYDVIHLYFSDGTDVKVIYEHGFWDYNLNKYVYLDKDAEQYIGHTFAKQNGNELAKVKLTEVVIEKAVTTAWSPVTADHLCYFVNGMLSMPGGVGGLFNIFDVDAETMTYDMEALARDIETYGLFTYEELNAIVELPEEMFKAAGGAYLKVSIGKGNLTMDELVYMIERYTKYFK